MRNAAIFAKRKQQRSAEFFEHTHSGHKDCEKHFFVVCAQTFAPLAGGLKINYTHLSLRLSQRRRGKETRAAQSEKKRPTFYEFNCFATRCSLKCGAHYIATCATNKSGRGDNIDAFSSPKNRYCSAEHLN